MAGLRNRGQEGHAQEMGGLGYEPRVQSLVKYQTIGVVF